MLPRTTVFRQLLFRARIRADNAGTRKQDGGTRRGNRASGNSQLGQEFQSTGTQVVCAWGLNEPEEGSDSYGWTVTAGLPSV